MTTSTANSLIALHSAFWERRLEQPIVNVELSMTRRFRHVPALPSQWANHEGLILEPAMLSPQVFQPAPVILDQDEPLVGKQAFNTMVPYFRVPWPVGIMGCELRVSTASQTVWPVAYLDDGWHELPNQGFSPRLDWLDKLLDFVQYLVEEYYPHSCLPAQDMIVRGIGDLCINIMEPERFYYSLYDHPQAVKALLAQITDLYIWWAQSQLERMPRFHDGYCNQYGTWCPGTSIRFQEDYAINLSPRLFHEFLMPCAEQVVRAFDYSVIHTHSGCPQLAEWMLDLGGLSAIEVSLDPTGPTIEDQIPLWNRILEKKCLYVCGPVTQRQFALLISELSPRGLWLDLEFMEEGQESVWEWDQTRR